MIAAVGMGPLAARIAFAASTRFWYAVVASEAPLATAWMPAMFFHAADLGRHVGSAQARARELLRERLGDHVAQRRLDVGRVLRQLTRYLELEGERSRARVDGAQRRVARRE